MARRGLFTAALLLAALLIGAAGSVVLPPDEHEVLVLETSRGMLVRNDWLVPWFNGQPRLKKPPLSYWLTAATAAVTGAQDQVLPWHGRIPSLLAGLALLAGLLAAGRHLYDDTTALTAGALLAGSVGFYAYTHDARPDMLYAALCGLGMLAGTVGLSGVSTRPGRWVLGMWAIYGLATLAKGPHIPLLLLLGTGLAQWRAGRSLRELAPARGVALLLVIAVPWWLALRWVLADMAGDGEAVGGSQLSGTLLVPSLAHLWNGYYLYRPLQLLLPWLPLVPLAWWGLWCWHRRAGTAASTAARADALLTWPACCVLLGLSLGTQQRYFYALPLLGALSLLGARGLVLMSNAPRLLLVQAVLVAGASLWLLASGDELSAGLPAVLGALALAGWSARRGTLLPAVPLALLLMLMAAYALPGSAARLWSDDRRLSAAFAAEVAARVPAGAPLLTLAQTPELYVYHTGRTVPRVPDAAALEDRLDGMPGQGAYVIMAVHDVARLRPRYEVERVAVMPAGADDRAGLYRVTRRQGSDPSRERGSP